MTTLTHKRLCAFQLGNDHGYALLSTQSNAFSLRPARQADFPAIRALIRAEQLNPMGLDWPHFIVAVDANDRMIACGQVKQHAGGLYELASIATLPDWRGRGVASRIIRRLMDDHPLPLYLTCRGRMHDFYTRFGFRSLQWSEMPPYYRRLKRLAELARRIRLTDEEMLVMWSGFPRSVDNDQPQETPTG